MSLSPIRFGIVYGKSDLRAAQSLNSLAKSMKARRSMPRKGRSTWKKISVICLIRKSLSVDTLLGATSQHTLCQSLSQILYTWIMRLRMTPHRSRLSGSLLHVSSDTDHCGFWRCVSYDPRGSSLCVSWSSQVPYKVNQQENSAALGGTQKKRKHTDQKLTMIVDVEPRTWWKACKEKMT